MADVEWATIKDFSPGIQQIVSPNHPIGAAQETRTYKCHSIKDGALAPLPSMQQTIPHDLDLLSPGATLLSEEYRIAGLCVNNPVFWTDNETGIYQNNSEIYVAFEHWEDDGGTEQQVLTVCRYKRNLNTPVWETLDTRIYAQTFDPEVRPKKCEFITIRSNPASVTDAGPMVVCWAFAGWAQCFPDPTTPTVNSTAFLPGDNVDDVASGGLVGPDGIVAHQGRAVQFPLAVLAVGDDQLYTTNESLFWSILNDVETMDTTIGSSYFKTIVSYDNPTGYQVYQSLTANELLLIKARGGALVVSGNLNDFQVRNLPNVRGTGHSMNRGSVSPKGFVYPTDAGGVWVWGGGDESEHITKYMEPDFWRPPAVSPANDPTPTENLWGYQPSKCTDWNQFVMFPNNWLWDTDFDGWWKIDDGADFVIHKWEADWRGLNCYGTPSGFTTDTDAVLYEFNKTIPASNYSWESHPLPFSVERNTEIRNIIPVTTGDGTVQIVLRSVNDQTGTITKTFTVDAAKIPNVQDWSTSIKGTHHTIQIISIGADTDTPAPTVHEIRIGYISSQMIERV